MNTTAETLQRLGVRDQMITDETRFALIATDLRKSLADRGNDDLRKSIAPRFAGGFDFSPFAGTQFSADTLSALEKLGLGELSKSITTQTGLVAYDLQAPAKNLYPFYAPIRNFLPRVGGGTGTATNWRQVNAIIGSGFDSIGWVPEGQRSGQMSYNTSNRSATYVTIGEEDAATYEAISAGRQFEDVQARMTFRLLQKMML